MSRILSDGENSAVAYEQMGADMGTTDENQVNGKDYIVFTAVKRGSADDTGSVGHQTKVRFDGRDPHWVGIMNIGSSGDETAEVQAYTLSGDDLTADADNVVDQDRPTDYISIQPGEIIHGQCTEVFLQITDGPGYTDTIRLIRGV